MNYSLEPDLPMEARPNIQDMELHPININSTHTQEVLGLQELLHLEVILLQVGIHLQEVTHQEVQEPHLLHLHLMANLHLLVHLHHLSIR